MSTRSSRLPVGSLRARQDGVVLLVALIVLVAMTLAGVALIRSVDTANVIAGNLAFHHSATNAGDRSSEQAIAKWLAMHSAVNDNTLHQNSKNLGYLASTSDGPKDNESWDTFWKRIQDNDNQVVTVLARPPQPTCPGKDTLDAACNEVRFVIQRLCANAGDPDPKKDPATGCTQPPPSESPGESFVAGQRQAVPPRKQVYYRITTQIKGPRGTVSYIQTIVAI